MVDAGVYGVEPGDQRAEADGGGGGAPSSSGNAAQPQSSTLYIYITLCPGSNYPFYIVT